MTYPAFSAKTPAPQLLADAAATVPHLSGPAFKAVITIAFVAAFIVAMRATYLIERAQDRRTAKPKATQAADEATNKMA